MKEISRKCIRWASAFLLVGLWTGYGPFHHYLHGGVDPSCPWAPVHAHVVLIGWVGLTLIGLVYRALPDWGEPDALSVKLARASLWLTIATVLGVTANGIFGYRLLDRLSPSFYYVPDHDTLRLWLSIDGVFLSLFLFAGVCFVVVVFRSTRARRESAA